MLLSINLNAQHVNGRTRNFQLVKIPERRIVWLLETLDQSI